VASPAMRGSACARRLIIVIAPRSSRGLVKRHSASTPRHGGAAPLPAGLQQHQRTRHLLYTQYVYPFELAAVLLLVAIVAAIALTMRRARASRFRISARSACARGPRADGADAATRWKRGRMTRA
jgi:hypothetical protein